MSTDPVLYKYVGKTPPHPSEEELAAGVPVPMPPHHPGVPLRDLTAADLQDMPRWLQETIAASDLYRATKPAAESAPKAKAEKE